MLVIAFAVRLAVIPFLVGDATDPSRDHWNMGCEEGRLARSLAAGEGYGSPLFGETGPSAWTNPVYPAILAGVFRIFGIYSNASAWAILILNAVFSALTCIPVYFIALRCFGLRTAKWSAWLWCFYPYAIYFTAGRVWGYCLDTLMVALLLWATLAIEKKQSYWQWIAYGLLWGFAAFNNAVVLMMLPFLWGWLLWRRAGDTKQSIFRMSVAGFALVLVVTPWFLRNYNVFHRFVPFRSEFWYVFWQSNTGDTSDLYPDWANASQNDAEMKLYRDLGEIGYMQSKRVLAVDFVRKYPGLIVWLSIKRFIFVWTGFWSLRSDYLANEPFAFPNIGFASVITIFAFLGFRRAWKTAREAVIPIALVLLSYPLIYYIVHPGMDYRHPIEPSLVILIGFFIASKIDAKHASRELAPAQAA